MYIPIRLQYYLYFKNLRVTVLFGGDLTTDVAGVSPDQSYNDMWQWDGQTWKEISNEILPSNRNLFSSMVYDVERDQLVLFGGQLDFSAYRPNETWLFQFTSGMPSSVWLNY